MPYEIEIQASGVWAWILANPGALAAKRITSYYRKAQKQAFAEFVTSKGPGNDGIQRRFSEAYGKQVTPRSSAYMKRVRRFYGGRYLPFMSPTRQGADGQGHLRSRIAQEGGYNLRNKNKVEEVTTVLTLPAARALNFRPQYRPEFLDLNGRNRADGVWLEQRTHEIAWPQVKNEMKRAARRLAKGKSA